MDMLKIDWPVSLKSSVGNTELFPTPYCPHPLSFLKDALQRDQDIERAALIAKYGLPSS